jgi:rod shape-determining protein MreC
MLKKIFARKISKVVLIVAVCALLIFWGPFEFFRPGKIFIGKLTAPFQKIAYLSSKKIADGKDFILAIGDLKKENERLMSENMKLSVENAKFRDVEKQNEALRKELGLLPMRKFQLETAYVISYDPDGSGKWVEISKGEENGIKEGMPVVVGQGTLAGRVEIVSKGTSRISLLTNPQSAVSAMTSNSQAKGIVRGEYGLGVIFDMVLQTEELKIGDEIITSGVGRDFPRGLFIGKVTETRTSPDGLFKQAKIVSPVEFSKLEIVSIVTGTR